MSILRHAHENILSHGYFQWFIRDEKLQASISSLMDLWINYCKNYLDHDLKKSHWPVIDGKKIGYRLKFDNRGNLKKESLLLSLSYLDMLPASLEDELGFNTIKGIKDLIHELYEDCITSSSKVLNMGQNSVNEVNVAEEIMRDKHMGVLHLSHYLPNGEEFFSDPHLYSGYATYLLAESGDNIEVLSNKDNWSLIGLNPGQVLVMLGSELKDRFGEVPLVEHRIRSSPGGRFAIKLFPSQVL